MIRLLSLVVGTLLWEAAARFVASPFFPAFSAVLAAAARLIASGDILPPLAASVLGLLAGFGLAAASGIAVGAAMGRSRAVEHLLDLYLYTLLAAPTLIYVPVLFTLFGISRETPIAVQAGGGPRINFFLTATIAGIWVVRSVW